MTSPLFVSGKDADDCLIKTLKVLKKHGSTVKTEHGTVYRSDYPAVICLENPLMRFSFLPGKDPRKGIVLGLAALAGINNDGLLAEFDKSFLQGPPLRGFNGEYKPYNVSLKYAGRRIGNIDQLAETVDRLAKNSPSSQHIGFLDPKKIKYSDGVLCMGLSNSPDKDSLDANVYVSDLDVCGVLADYVIPVFTFIQQIAASLLGKKLGKFHILSDAVRYAENEYSQSVLEKSLPRVGETEFEYRESKAFDLRYLDMTVQHLMDFLRRVQEGDLSVKNPFDGKGHLECFHDYGEAFRYGEAADRDISWDDKPQIIHPQLAYYYDLP